jgi:hypothetical protein
MQKFYVTFGQIWRTLSHPQKMHPDGWATVYADDWQEAHNAARELFVERFSVVYKEDELDLGRFPRGELAVAEKGKDGRWNLQWTMSV